MSFSLLQTLDENKIHKKKIFIEYVIDFSDKKYSFLIPEEESEKFEKEFDNSNINSIEDFTSKFQNITIENI
jgi:hypothetical protein